MKTKMFISAGTIGAGLIGVCAMGVGCSKDPDIDAQQKAAKGMPPPSKEQLQRGFAEIAANHEKARQDSENWAKAHPDELAKVNAARAAAGKPPLGQ